MELILLTAAVIFLAIYLWLHRAAVPNLPPFPRRPLPVVGNLFHMTENPRPLFKKWRAQFGDIFSLSMGKTLVVVLNGYDVLKEALVKRGDAFSDRSPIFFDEATGLAGKGIGFSSGHNWKEQRSVSLTILKKFGFGKNILAEKIQEEASNYVNYIASKKGEPMDIQVITNISTCNVICSIIIGHRFDYDDEEFKRLIAHLNSTTLDQRNVSLINFISWLKYLPGDLFLAKKITRNVEAVFGLIKSFVVAKKRDAEDSFECNNFIEAYLEERKKKIKSGTPTYMDDENLAKNILDLFGAGTETSSTTIYWFVLYMLNYPIIQEKLYQEIKEVIGTDRKPNMLDRSQMPYFHAAILETQRLGSIVPLSLMRLCSEDVTLRGYSIPKGTFIITNLDSVLHDKAIWGEDVMTFKPERFLDDHGKVIDREEHVPFGMGRRVCLGEALAKMELFLFMTNLLQRFQFLPQDKVPPPYHDYRFGLTCAPFSYKVRMVERK